MIGAAIAPRGARLRRAAASRFTIQKGTDPAKSAFE
jgi:hypothetical protein